MRPTIRLAGPDDWELVSPFFERHYRAGHPFQHEAFWRWQTEDADQSGAFVALGDDGVVGHTAFNRGGGVVWGLMMMVDPEWRGRGLFTRLISALASRGTLAVTNANDLAIRLLRRAGWHEHPDLVRYVAVRPGVAGEEAVTAVQLTGNRETPTGHYWRQPGIEGLQLEAGTGVAQPSVGGLRVVDIEEAPALLAEAWDLGFRWVDYLTSPNDPILDRLEPDTWEDEDSSAVPWRLDPVVPGSRANIRVLSLDGIPDDLVIRRTYSDHGRVGSLPGRTGEASGGSPVDGE